MNFSTKEQEVVVQARLAQGYSLLGVTTSLFNAGKAFVVSKGKHCLVINSLGYDEHVKGVTWTIQ